MTATSWTPRSSLPVKKVATDPLPASPFVVVSRSLLSPADGLERKWARSSLRARVSWTACPINKCLPDSAAAPARLNLETSGRLWRPTSQQPAALLQGLGLNHASGTSGTCARFASPSAEPERSSASCSSHDVSLSPTPSAALAALRLALLHRRFPSLPLDDASLYVCPKGKRVEYRPCHCVQHKCSLNDADGKLVTQRAYKIHQAHEERRILLQEADANHLAIR